MKYYKITYEYSKIMFIFDETLDAIRGMIEEIRTKSRLSLYKHENTMAYARVSRNTSAQALINKSTEITKEEYEAVTNTFDDLMNSEKWIISDDGTNNKEVTTDTVFV